MNVEPPSDTASVPGPERRRWRLVGRVAIGAGIGILLLAAAGYWNAHRIADETIVRHRARFERERVALAAQTRTRPAILEPAAAGTAEEVAARFEAAVAAVPEEERKRLTPWVYDPSDAAPPEEEDRILAAHPEPLAALAQILYAPSAAPLAPLGPDFDKDTSVPPRQEASRWASAALRRAIARSDRALAFRLVAQTVAFGADYGRRGTLVARLVGAGIQHVGLSPLFDLLASGPVDVLGARTLLRTLDVVEAAQPTLAETVDVERASVRGMFSLSAMAEDKGLRKTGWRHLWSAKVLRADALDELDDDMDRLRAILAAPNDDPPRAIAAAERLQEGVENLLARMPLTVFPMVMRREASHAALRRVSRASLAVALHVARTGTAPASLDELVPLLLARVPTDPWDGKPLRYAKGPPTKVWSVGRDGNDDGGAPYAYADSDEGPGDVVVTVGTTR